MNIDSQIPSIKIGEYEVNDNVSIETIATSIWAREGIKVMPKGGEVNGFLVGEDLPGNKYRVHVYVYTENKPSFVEKKEYVKGEIFDYVHPEIKAKGITSLRGN